jgi:hypothetical protein
MFWSLSGKAGMHRYSKNGAQRQATSARFAIQKCGWYAACLSDARLQQSLLNFFLFDRVMPKWL